MTSYFPIVIETETNGAVSAQAVPEASRFDADDRIRFRVERGASAQDLDGDHRFLDLAWTSLECSFDDRRKLLAPPASVKVALVRIRPSCARTRSLP